MVGAIRIGFVSGAVQGRPRRWVRLGNSVESGEIGFVSGGAPSAGFVSDEGHWVRLGNTPARSKRSIREGVGFVSGNGSRDRWVRLGSPAGCSLGSFWKSSGRLVGFVSGNESSPDWVR